MEKFHDWLIKLANELMNLVHIDVCVPMKTTMIGGVRYFVMFVDDYSRKTFLYYLM